MKDQLLSGWLFCHWEGSISVDLRTATLPGSCQCRKSASCRLHKSQPVNVLTFSEMSEPTVNKVVIIFASLWPSYSAHQRNRGCCWCVVVCPRALSFTQLIFNLMMPYHVALWLAPALPILFICFSRIGVGEDGKEEQWENRQDQGYVFWIYPLYLFIFPADNE